MKYIHLTYSFANAVVHYISSYLSGRKGLTRRQKNSSTSDATKRYNLYCKTRKLQLILLANFKAGDDFITLTYSDNKEKDANTVKKDIKAFIEKLRKAYKRRGAILKFIYRIEIGKKGRVHCHMVINHMPDTNSLVNSRWKHGYVQIKTITDKDPSFAEIASYLAKPLPDICVALYQKTHPFWSLRYLVSYSRSRNLITPVPSREVISLKTVQRMLHEGIKPTKGFYVDKGIKPPYSGINPFTGQHFLRYQELLLEPQK
ncbi:MAG: hypothetical protein K6G81_11930 [Lachnospiraceae bacterium]|nr:hypothetical protein [Lachnospiraceae bacterium]